MISSRMVRGMTMSLREREFIRAARYMGVSSRRIIVGHVVPNVASILIIDAALNVASAILAETGLSFLGFGIQPPDVSLGTLIADGTQSATTFPWVFLFPAGVLVLILVCANLTGDGLRDALDPGSARRCEVAPDEPAAGGDRPGRHLPDRRPTGDRGARHQLQHRPGRSRGHGRRIGLGQVACRRWRWWACCRSTRDVRGSVRLHGTELLGLGDDAMSRFRGKAVGMVFQDPMSALTPGLHRRRPDRRGDRGAPAARRARRPPAGARWNCSSWSASRSRSGAPARFRTSCPAANASGW